MMRGDENLAFERRIRGIHYDETEEDDDMEDDDEIEDKHEE